MSAAPDVCSKITATSFLTASAFVKLTLRLAGYRRRGNIGGLDCVTVEVKEHDRADKGSKDG